MTSENIDHAIARSETEIHKYLKERNIWLKIAEKQAQNSVNSLSSGLNSIEIVLATSELKITFYHSHEDRNQFINPNYASVVKLLYRERFDITQPKTNKFDVKSSTDFKVQLLYSKQLDGYSSESKELGLYENVLSNDLYWDGLYFVEKPNFLALSKIRNEFVQITNF